MAIVVSFVVLVVGGLLVGDERVVVGEHGLFEFVNGWPDALEPPLWVVMQAGTLGAIGLATVVALVRRRPDLALRLAVAGLAAYAAARVVKAIVDRPRPAALVAGAKIRDTSFSGSAYPSSHVAVAAALAAVVALAPRASPRLRLTAVAVVMAVGVARMYVGAHLPLDVVGGAALGLALGAVADMVRRR